MCLLSLQYPLGPKKSLRCRHFRVLRHCNTPIALIFPGTMIKQFARYLGAPIGKDLHEVLQSLYKREMHATGVHGKLLQVNEWSVYGLLRYVAVPRTHFLPTVMHPKLVNHYTDSFDAMTNERWNAITSISPQICGIRPFLCGGRFQQTKVVQGYQ